jgi:GNAT superfamily N-acetyltransferase
MLITRAATEEDAALIRELISELADYERESEQVRSAVADISRDGFMENPQFRALMAEWRGQPAGFVCFSATGRVPAFTFRTSLPVRAYRGRGVGTALLARVAHSTEQESSPIRSLDSSPNHPAAELLKSLGANSLDQWRTVVLTSEELRRLAAKNT